MRIKKSDNASVIQAINELNESEADVAAIEQTILMLQTLKIQKQKRQMALIPLIKFRRA